MATTAESSPSTNSSTLSGGGEANSPTKFHRSNLSSPWVQVVCRGDSSESAGDANCSSPASIPSPPWASAGPVQHCPLERSSSKHQPPPAPLSSGSPGNSWTVESSHESDGINVGTSVKKPAWNKVPNGVAEATSPVMGGSSWPALSESTRPSPKSSADSSKSAADGSVSVTQGPVTSDSRPKCGSANANPNSSTNNTTTLRQRSMKRGVGGNRVGGFGHAPPPPLLGPTFPAPEMPLNSFGVPVPIVPTPMLREARSSGGSASQSHAVSDHHVHQNISRPGPFGQNARGDGPHNNNLGSRRDHERGNYDYNSSSIFNARGIHAQARRAHGRGHMRPPALGPVQYMASQSMRSYGNAMIYLDISHHPVYYAPLPHVEAFRGFPFVPVPPPPPVYIPFMTPELPVPLSIVKQIDYYFSDINLVKDEFLKSKMDDEGWVPITLIASFPRVQNLTHSIPLILESLRASNVVEVQGDKVRRRDGWEKWILRRSSAADSGLKSPAQLTYEKLTSSFQNASLGNTAARSDSTVPVEADPGSNVAPGSMLI